MKYIFLLFTLFYFNFSISQDLSFECGNSIVTVSWEEIANNPNAYWIGMRICEIDEEVMFLFICYKLMIVKIMQKMI